MTLFQHLSAVLLVALTTAATAYSQDNAVNDTAIEAIKTSEDRASESLDAEAEPVEEQRWWQVEIIVFRHRNPNAYWQE